MDVRPESQPLPGVQRDSLSGKQFIAWKGRELGMRGAKCVRNSLVFIRQNAAGCIHEPAAWLHQPGRGGEDAVLLLGELGNRFRSVPPFEVRIAPQGAETAARRVDQHAVELAGEALGARIALAGEHYRMHIADARTRGARRERGEPLRRDVQRIDAPGAPHQHRHRERFSTCSRAVIGHHLAAARCKQPGEQLAALVLHLDQPVAEQRMAVDGRLSRQADACRGIRCRRGCNFILAQASQHCVARHARYVDTQIERRCIEHALCDAHGFGIAVTGCQPVP